MIYTFSNIEIDATQFCLIRNNIVVSVEPKVLELIIYLIAQRHRMVPKDELIKQVWNGYAVGPTSIPRAVCLARKAIDNRSIIRTIHSRGYQWAARVDMVCAPLAATSDASRVPG